MGRGGIMHQLRQVRTGLPYGGISRERQVGGRISQAPKLFALLEENTGATRMNTQPTKKVSVATVWLDGCSGCHMSLLDMDERFIEFAETMALVYSPLADAKEFPQGVDVTLVEGAVSSDEDEKRLRLI